MKFRKNPERKLSKPSGETRSASDAMVRIIKRHSYYTYIIIIIIFMSIL